jgi:hypothetical protein
MTHLVDRESWPDDQRPGSIAYLCGVMQGPAWQSRPAAVAAVAARDACAVYPRVSPCYLGSCGPSIIRTQAACGQPIGPYI